MAIYRQLSTAAILEGWCRTVAYPGPYAIPQLRAGY
jgi:hypothetical protein